MHPSMPRIHIAALGGLRIEREGEELADLLGQPVRCALLVNLAVERGATRDELAALLWPERSTRRARRLLSQNLYELRRQLGEGWLEAGAERAEVTAAVAVDALRFIAAVEAGHDEAALLEYGGAFLDGCHLGGTPAFEQWVDQRRSQLARLHRDVCRRLTAARIEQGDAEGALAVARRWAETDPLEDEAHHQIIALLAESGRRSEALRHYEEWRERIWRELEVEPLAETQALVARIREGAASAAEAQEPAEPHIAEGGAEIPPLPLPTATSPEPRFAPAAQGEEGPGPHQVLTTGRGQQWLLGSLAAILVAGMILLWSGAILVAPVDPADESVSLDPRGIAVLPFVNLSADPEQEYFSDGITEDLITSLSKISDLTVISRTSVMQYRDTTKTMSQIAEELGVAHLVEGSVRRAGDRVRISAQLIDARTDGHLWAETYDRDLTDIFEIQSEIAQQIAQALRARLTADKRERLADRPTDNLIAYDLYLLAREHLDQPTLGDNETAVSLFRRALELDPSFAHAYSGIAEAYWRKVNRFAQPFEWADSAVEAARTAVSLDPNLADGYANMASGYYVQGLLSRVREPAERAVRLNPNHARALNTLGNLKNQEGRFAEAISYYRRVFALDPARAEASLRNTLYVYARLGEFGRAEEVFEQVRARWADGRGTAMHAALLPLLQGRNEESRAHSQELVSRFPAYAGAWMVAGDAHLFSGDLQRAREHYARAYEISPFGYYPVFTFRLTPLTLGYTLSQTNERDRARALFQEFEEFTRREISRGMEYSGLRYMLAAVYAVQGNKPEAYRWLGEAVEGGWKDHLYLSRDPLFENLRGDVEFQRIVARNRAEIERQRVQLQQ